MTISEYNTEVQSILQELKVKNPSREQYGAHYTRSDVPGLLLLSKDKNLMRQYDGDYMNDPEEGRYLVDIMMEAAEACDHSCKRTFVGLLRELRNSRLLYSAYNKASFISCWTVVKFKESDWRSSDSLNHWRFYGDDGKGACMMIPLSHLVTIFPHSLYNVLYGRSLQGGGTSAALRPITRLFNALKNRFNACRGTPLNAKSDLQKIIEATHPLLFLFKSADYASEKEVRSIIHTSSYSKSEKVELDDRVPKRAFIPSKDGLISKDTIIHFGPKADPNLAIESLALANLLGTKIRTHISTKKYR